MGMRKGLSVIRSPDIIPGKDWRTAASRTAVWLLKQRKKNIPITLTGKTQLVGSEKKNLHTIHRRLSIAGKQWQCISYKSKNKHIEIKLWSYSVMLSFNGTYCNHYAAAQECILWSSIPFIVSSREWPSAVGSGSNHWRPTCFCIPGVDAWCRQAFFGVSEIKKILDVMAALKLNRFHLASDRRPGMAFRNKEVSCPCRKSKIPSLLLHRERKNHS